MKKTILVFALLVLPVHGRQGRAAGKLDRNVLDILGRGRGGPLHELKLLAILLLTVKPSVLFKCSGPQVCRLGDSSMISGQWVARHSHFSAHIPVMSLANELGNAFKEPSLPRAPPPLPVSLESSLADNIILDHGRLQPLDPATGAVLRDAGAERVQTEWRAPLDMALRYWLELPALVPNLRLISVYARGSIPRGLALEGSSDVDTIGFAVVRDSNDGPLSAWRANATKRQAALVQQFPFVAGLEMYLIAVPELSTLGQWLLTDSHASGVLDDAQLRTLDAFRIASQGLLLHGQDLVPRLPVPLPAPRLIYSLRADLLKATRTVTANRSTFEITDMQRLEVARWAGKRALRSGMELAACSGEFAFFSRDLLPCHRAIIQTLGKAAANHSLTVLQLTCLPQEEIQNRGGAKTVALELLESAERLHVELESKFLASHFAKPLTSFSMYPDLTPTWMRGAVQEVRNVRDSLASAVAQVQRVASLLFDQGVSRDQSNQNLISDPLIPLSLVKTGPQGSSLRVLELQWQTSAGKRKRVERIAQRALAAARRPVLLRGAAAELAPFGSEHWNIPALPSLINSGGVRVSPDATFIFCKEAHQLCKSGMFPMPSRVTQMSGEEFVDRILQTSPVNRRPPLFYGSTERYYMQADVPATVLDVRRVPQLWRALGLTQAQPMRLWVSTHGATTPLHFDAAASFLAQMRGEKRIVFFPPSALSGLYPYPIDHPLNRRSRVPLHGCPDSRRESFPLFESVEAQAQEVILSEGDVILFPEHWWHHVETISPLSCSVGCRYI